MKTRQKSNLSRKKRNTWKGGGGYIIQRAIKAEVGKMVGGLCVCGGERAQKAGKKAWFAMEETREKDSKEKANVLDGVCIY